MMLASARKADGVIVPGLRVLTATGVLPCHIPVNKKDVEKYSLPLHQMLNPTQTYGLQRVFVQNKRDGLGLSMKESYSITSDDQIMFSIEIQIF